MSKILSPSERIMKGGEVRTPSRTMSFVRWKLLSEARSLVNSRISKPSSHLVNLVSQMDAWVLEFGGRVFVPFHEWDNHSTTRSMSAAIDKIPENEIRLLGDIIRYYGLATSESWKDPEFCEETSFYSHKCEESQEFPRNALGLTKASRITARKDLFLKGYPIFEGDILELAYDGSKVRCQSFNWDLLKLQEELSDGSNWLLLS